MVFPRGCGRLLLAMIAGSGCSLETHGESSESPSPEISERPGELGDLARQDLGRVIERTRRSFARRGEVLLGGDANVGTSVSQRGIEVVPFQWESSSKSHREQASTAGRAILLDTRQIGRDGDARLASGTHVSVAEDGSGLIQRGDVAELVHNVDRGVQHSWRFAQQPGGTGDLVVRVAVAGQVFAGRTTSGLHFVDPSTGLGFGYSDGIWIDARGARTPVEAVYDGTEIVLAVPAAVVESSEFPAVLDPTVSAEYGFDNPVIGPAVGSQVAPDISYSGVSGAEYLAVWSDSRRETEFFYDIRAARLTATGAVVDPVGLHVPSTNIPGDQVSPAVAWTDDPDGAGGVPGHWFVVWTDTYLQPSMIRGMKIQTDWTSAPSLSPDFDVSERSDLSADSEPDVACSPTNAGRFAVSYRTAGGIQVRRYTKASVSAGFQDEITIVNQPTAAAPSIAAGDSPTGQAFFVAWSDSASGSGDIYGRSVAASGAGLGATLPISTQSAAQSEPAVAYAGTGNGWMAVWSDLRNGSSDIYGRAITNDGALLNGNEFLISSSSANVPATGTQYRASIAGATNSPYANRWLVTWQDNRSGVFDIYGARLQSGSPVTVLDASGVALSAAAGVQSDPAVTYNPATSEFFTAWSDGRSSSVSPDIYGSRVTALGSVVDPAGILIGTSANQQEAPAMAACSGKYLVVWADTRNGVDAPDIYGAITDNASPPTVLVSNIAISTASGRQDQPDVACNGSDFLVVWADSRNATRDIFGARVRASDGLVLDPSGISIAGNPATETDPAISYQGLASTFQVVWSDNRNGHYDVFGKRISNSGVVDHLSEVNISGNIAGSQILPDVTTDNNFGGTNTVRFFVTWQDGRTGGEFPNWDIYGRYLELNSTMGPQIAIATSSQDELAPAVATRPPQSSTNQVRGQLVVYEQVTAPGTADILVARISAANTVVSTVNLTNTAQVDEREPAISHRSGGLLVIGFRTSSTGTSFDMGVRGQDVVFSPLAPSGAAFDIANVSNIRERSPALACGSSLGCQATFRKYVEGPQSGSPPPTTLMASDRVRGAKLDY